MVQPVNGKKATEDTPLASWAVHGKQEGFSGDGQSTQKRMKEKKTAGRPENASHLRQRGL